MAVGPSSHDSPLLRTSLPLAVVLTVQALEAQVGASGRDVPGPTVMLRSGLRVLAERAGPGQDPGWAQLRGAGPPRMAHPSRLTRPVSPPLNLQGQAELCSFLARETITGEEVTVRDSRPVFSGPPAILCGERGKLVWRRQGGVEDRTSDWKGPPAPQGGLAWILSQ